MRKYEVEFFNTFHGRGIKIAWVNSIRVADLLIFFNILRGISQLVTSSWTVVIFWLSVRIPYTVSYTLVITVCHSSCPQDMSCSCRRWSAFLSRDVMLSATSYDEAQHQLATPRLLAPAYFILAGARKGQVSPSLLYTSQGKKGRVSTSLLHTCRGVDDIGGS